MKKIPIRQIKNTNIKQDSNLAFSIRTVEDLLDGKEMKQAVHRHDYYFILALKQASGIHEIDFVSYPIKDFALFFMRIGQVHQLSLDANSAGFIIQFNADFYYPMDKASISLLRKASNKQLCQLDEKAFSSLNIILSQIFEEFQAKKESYEEVIRSLLHILFIEIIRKRQNLNNQIDLNKAYSLERLEEFYQLIETNISKTKSVSEFAKMMKLTTYQLNSICKSITGKSSSELINEYIILEAKRYLLATSNQVNQIAYFLAYEDISYFIRFFKKHTGYSPENFRQKFK
jgi:AraC family transcriptional activator of pobA